MTTPITFDGHLNIHCKSGETLTFEDLTKVVSYEKLLEHLRDKAYPDVDQYWKLRAYEDDRDTKLVPYTFKGNVECAILNAVFLHLNVPIFDNLSSYIDDASEDLIREFFEQEKNHTLQNLEKFLIDQFVLYAHDYNSVMWLEETTEPILVSGVPSLNKTDL